MDSVVRQENPMAGVRSSDTDMYRILGCEVRHDMSFALTAPLAANKNIDQPLSPAPVVGEMTGYPHQNVFGRAAVRIDDDVRNALQRVDLLFRRVFSHLRIRRQLASTRICL